MLWILYSFMLHITAPTCFGNYMSSSGSIWVPSDLLVCWSDWVVGHLACSRMIYGTACGVYTTDRQQLLAANGSYCYQISCENNGKSNNSKEVSSGVVPWDLFSTVSVFDLTNIVCHFMTVLTALTQPCLPTDHTRGLVGAGCNKR
jgi:hypothetical protein